MEEENLSEEQEETCTFVRTGKNYEVNTLLFYLISTFILGTTLVLLLYMWTSTIRRML